MGALSYLDHEQRDQVQALVLAATTADGVAPLSEHVMLHLREGGDEEDLHFLAYRDQHLAAYAHLDLTDHIDGPSAEIVVSPADRGHGVGSALMKEVIALAGPRLRLWSHGDLPVAARLADVLGFARVRMVLQMHLSLTSTPLPVLDVQTRPFLLGQDEDAWLGLNARAFADHPEQGVWTRADLNRRMAEEWFDPQGLLVLERGGKLIASCWTKVHGSQRHHDHAHEAIGEIYVVAVDPHEQGNGLGRAVTLAGLHHLQRQGLSAAMLYVDATNASAIALYNSLGFTEWGRDVMYRAR